MGSLDRRLTAMRSGETVGPGGQLAVFQTTGREESSSEGPQELSDEPAPRRCSRRVQGLWKPCCYISRRILDFPAALVTRTEGGDARDELGSSQRRDL